jgi:hypothetical protein
VISSVLMRGSLPCAAAGDSSRLAQATGGRAMAPTSHSTQWVAEEFDRRAARPRKPT